ncbi:DUF3082 domain-containing protein [Prochlorococcus sp. MIT 1307]|uniref:DUF3082 domain-containing protein n=1 Tax=Prochlorococcus sp. MIT 1307 TaxID=3096219 RepID=UPI002A74AE7A|nr:DUF3082 domain-containing protein [Prochlorococcus sp. MIT 1307]
MSDSKNPILKGEEEKSISPQKGPLSFFSGAITSIFLSWICLELSQRMVIYFTLHSPAYSSPIAQSVASGFKTLVIGISFLATFTFGFIGLGLILVFIRSLFDGNAREST